MKRYDAQEFTEMALSDDGDFVFYSDAERLKKALESLITAYNDDTGSDVDLESLLHEVDKK